MVRLRMQVDTSGFKTALHGKIFRARRARPFFEDDGGFSTVAMALALLISLSLVLGSAHIYRIQTSTARVQNIADVCALAAENEVASFYIVAQVCDSALLSLSLAGGASIGLGIVAACVPAAQEFSVQLIQAGKNILQARRSFAQACTEGLNNLQSLLPIFAALNSAALAQSNAGAGSSYMALTMLVPFEGVDLHVQESEAEQTLLEGIDQSREDIAGSAQEAEDAAQAANAHKQAAFMADCGNSPHYCMYERAERLAGMQGSENPHYASVDTWSFSVALQRARAYYAHRYASEAPASESVEDQVRSAVRSRFYAYACEELSQAYVDESEDSFSAYFPLLARNTAEMRTTRLYTEAVWPITQTEEGECHMHAWLGCPQAQQESYWGIGSVEQMESGSFERCAACDFSASSVGKVAAASTSINNGFEYHYHIVAQEAAAYEKERRAFSQQAKAVKTPVKKILEQLKDLLSTSASYRLHVQPPGRTGALAIVLDPGGLSVADMASTRLLPAVPALGPSLAISAATLADDDADETQTVISSLLDGLLQDATQVSVGGVVLDIWSNLLVAYTNGSRSLVQSIEHSLDRLPLLGASGLGPWAAQKLQSTIEKAGFSPPDLKSHKPVVVNTYHVAASDSGAVCAGLLQAKQAVAQSYGGIAQNGLSAVVGIAGGMLLSSYTSWDARFVVARIELFGENGPSIPIEISLPPAIKEAGTGIIEGALDKLLALSGQAVEVRRWE